MAEEKVGSPYRRAILEEKAIEDAKAAASAAALRDDPREHR